MWKRLILSEGRRSRYGGAPGLGAAPGLVVIERSIVLILIRGSPKSMSNYRGLSRHSFDEGPSIRNESETAPGLWDLLCKMGRGSSTEEFLETLGVLLSLEHSNLLWFTTTATTYCG